MIKTLVIASALLIGAGLTSVQAAEREQVRMVINLISGVKMPFPENLRNNLAHTERVELNTNGATVACLRLDDKFRWCFEHIAPIGNRAEMLRIRKEPIMGLLPGQSYQYVDDIDLDGTIDIGSTTRLDGEPSRPPMSSRIIKAANAFDDLVGSSLDPGRAAAAVQRLRLDTASEYDPDTVEALNRVVNRRSVSPL